MTVTNPARRREHVARTCRRWCALRQPDLPPSRATDVAELTPAIRSRSPDHKSQADPEALRVVAPSGTPRAHLQHRSRRLAETSTHFRQMLERLDDPGRRTGEAVGHRTKRRPAPGQSEDSSFASAFPHAAIRVVMPISARSMSALRVDVRDGNQRRIVPRPDELTAAVLGPNSFVRGLR